MMMMMIITVKYKIEMLLILIHSINRSTMQVKICVIPGRAVTIERLALET